MRNLIINYFFLLREFKLFGKNITVFRAAMPTVLAFFFGVLFQTLFSTGTFFTFVLWIPFMIAIYFGFFYYRVHPLKYHEIIDWQQQWQYLHKPGYSGTKDTTFPKGQYYVSELKRLGAMHELHFGKSSFVDVAIGIAPTLITLIGAALFVLINNLVN